MIAALFILGWLVCGVLAFGMYRYDWSERIRQDWMFQVWDIYDTRNNYVFATLGPLSILVLLIDIKHRGLRFRLPDDVRKPRVKP